MNAERAYIEFIKEVSEAGCGSMYGVDRLRVELHEAVLRKHGYEDYYERSKNILDHLDMAIGFEVPFQIGDSVRFYAAELERLLSCTECRGYMTGVLYALNTAYGRLENDTWIKSEERE